MAPARKKTTAKSKAPARKTSKRPVAKKVAAKRAPAKKAAATKKAPVRKAPPKAPKKPLAAKKPAARRPASKPAAKAKPAFAREVSRALAQAEVEGLVQRLPPPVQPVVNRLRQVVLEVAPEASEGIDAGAPAYFANGIFARIEPGEREVLVRFLRAGQLPSAGDLSGDALSLQDLDEVRESVLRKLVREAVALNLKALPS